jgi:glycosyltransferase involved in cell wall biosynthesis
LIPENPTSATGRIYQRFIRSGFRRARHFISISNRTRDELHREGGVMAVTSEVVYNGLNHPDRPLSPEQAATVLKQAGMDAPTGEFLLHVGGGQWYKNSGGVLALYGALARKLRAAGRAVPALWLVSPEPGAGLRAQIIALPEACRVRFLSNVPAMALQALYSTAQALLFPSLAEGFGWPIAEGLACGCAVVTTGEAPMNEVGGDHAHYLPLRRVDESLVDWAEAGAALLMTLLDRPAPERQVEAEAGRRWAERFDAAHAIDQYLQIYARVLALERPTATLTTNRSFEP